tara:strand:- start:922 stop:1272 length:351 start_codon:yes stop_codon:yes gene_type:complete
MTESLTFYGGADIISTPLSVVSDTASKGINIFTLENLTYIILILYLLFILYFNMKSDNNYGHRWSIATSSDVCPPGTKSMKLNENGCRRCTSHDLGSGKYVPLAPNWETLYPACGI